MLKAKIILLILSIIFLNTGCNTITGAAKGIVEDIKEIIPGG